VLTDPEALAAPLHRDRTAAMALGAASPKIPTRTARQALDVRVVAGVASSVQRRVRLEIRQGHAPAPGSRRPAGTAISAPALEAGAAPCQPQES
jgi:hypothetical protein